jgi:hypothetical protein
MAQTDNGLTTAQSKTLLTAEMASNSQDEQEADAETLNRKLNELRMAIAVEHSQTRTSWRATSTPPTSATTRTAWRRRPRPTSTPPRPS